MNGRRKSAKNNLALEIFRERMFIYWTLAFSAEALQKSNSNQIREDTSYENDEEL
jgi:hypothetical protein